MGNKLNEGEVRNDAERSLGMSHMCIRILPCEQLEKKNVKILKRQNWVIKPRGIFPIPLRKMKGRKTS